MPKSTWRKGWSRHSRTREIGTIEHSTFLWVRGKTPAALSTTA
ncbi:MAG: hypothetical protein ACLSUW_10815 [Akkermansia sp.]